MSTDLLDAGHSLVALIDLQERLLAAMPESDRSRVVEASAILLAAAGTLDIPVVYSEQYPKGLGATVPAVRERLPSGSVGVEKTAFSCYAVEDFRKALGDRSQLVLLGQEAHVCVLQTALEANAAGRRVFVVEEAVCSRFPAHKQNALARLRAAGVVVTNVESVLFEWLRDAAHPAFKAVSALIPRARP
ncbi:isochorismatase family protein [Candidatus Methylocalor cossyra]|uniref:Isochorismatase n=1 Tax=Candidatus Methylocalor cossyra TaxID=3108543 RepID=A0ABP1CC74_9GAMM